MPIQPHELPLSKRLDYIDRIFIRHPAINLATQALRHLTHAPARRREATLGYIRGYSRCGKSETLKRHIERMTGVPVARGLDQLIPGAGELVIYVELASGDTPLGVANRILDLFGDLNRRPKFTGERHLTEREAIRRAIYIANDNGVSLLALDEVQNLLRNGTDAAIEATGSMLITMQDAAEFPIAITGSPRLQWLFDGHDAVKSRAGPRTMLRPLPFRTAADRAAFKSIIGKYAANMPFAAMPDLAGKEWLDATFFSTRGRLGRLTALLRAATSVAFDECRAGVPGELSVSHLKRAFDLLHDDDPDQMDVNPWQAGIKLPEIPLTIEEVIEKASRLTLRDKPRSRTRGRSLLDE